MEFIVLFLGVLELAKVLEELLPVDSPHLHVVSYGQIPIRIEVWDFTKLHPLVEKEKEVVGGEHLVTVVVLSYIQFDSLGLTSNLGLLEKEVVVVITLTV